MQQCKETCSTGVRLCKMFEVCHSVCQWCHKGLVRVGHCITLVIQLPSGRDLMKPNVRNVLHFCSPGNLFRDEPLDVDGRPLSQASINGSQIGDFLYGAQKLQDSHTDKLHTQTLKVIQCSNLKSLEVTSLLLEWVPTRHHLCNKSKISASVLALYSSHVLFFF